jgi:nucleotide-binding universal stress UspA family protein
LRGLAAEYAKRAQEAQEALAAATARATPITSFTYKTQDVSGAPIMCAIRGAGKTLDLAIDVARQTHRPLYMLFVRTLPVLTAQDYKRKWQDDEEAREIFVQAKSRAEGHPVYPCYAVSDAVAHTIVDITATMGASYLLLGAPERGSLTSLLRGSIIKEISDILPDDIHLLVLA